MLPDSGSFIRGVHVWEVPFAFMLFPGWYYLLAKISEQRGNRFKGIEEFYLNVPSRIWP